MEKEGLKRSLDVLRAHGVTFDSIVTDRLPQVQKFLRETNIMQYYDVWCIEKGISSCVWRWVYVLHDHVSNWLFYKQSRKMLRMKH